ncbi:putative alcohol acetyltransferase FCK4 [Fusarium austroafricanum]|uniref:Putative alcohol acetyltransferase FCK4 n=1 Tax=Fusarium austroafricanum TaxID=2364996 RepID=A0A8H4NW61_9HYPO|nr:putative alcohol acetyltransferase FCK4 [Fusarium austroafricanum]
MSWWNMASKTAEEFSVVRDCGPSERMFTAWHHLGLYYRISNTAALRIPRAKLGNASVSHLIRTAVAQVMLKQPVMRVGIIGEHTKRPQFVALSSIDLSQQIEDAQAASLGDVAKSLEKFLLQPWPDLSRRPGWHVQIFHETNLGEAEFCRVRICLTVHHAICDGMSMAIFLSNLIKALNDPDSDVVLMVDKSPIIELTDDLTDYPPPQDQAVKLTGDLTWVLSQLWRYGMPKILKPFSLKKWGGGPYDPHIKALHLRYMEIDSTYTQAIIKKCRQKGSTLTNLLNALCIVSFARRAPITERHGFENSTSISLRPWISDQTPLDKERMSLRVSGYNPEFGPDILDKVRHGVDSDVWDLAVRLRQDMKRKTDTMPHNDFSFLVPYTGDFLDLSRSMYGKERDVLWGLSNLGSIAAPPENSPWQLENVMFAQIYPTVTAALAVSVASVDGGDMIICFMWQDGILETKLVEDVKDDFETWLMNLGKEGYLGV